MFYFNYLQAVPDLLAPWENGSVGSVCTGAVTPVVIIVDFVDFFLDEAPLDGVHHRGWNLRLPLLPLPVLHGVPGVQKHQREKVVSAGDDQSSASALRGALAFLQRRNSKKTKKKLNKCQNIKK